MKITISYHTGDMGNPIEETHEANYSGMFHVTTRGIGISSFIVTGDEITVYSDTKPTRIDFDTECNLLCIMGEKGVKMHPQPYSLLSHPEKSETVWSDPDSPKEEG